MKNNIFEIHNNCLDFLLRWQANHKDFYFVPRKINNKNRLNKGMYFRGNENYLVLSFWNSSDSKEIIYNISWGCYADGSSYIDLSCRDNDNLVPYMKQIIEVIESKTDKHFDEAKVNKWRYFYNKEENYLQTLQDFIVNEKVWIDEYLLAHPEAGIPLADKEINEKYVKTLPGYKEYEKAANTAKKSGSVVVKPSEYIMKFQHNELSNEMVKYLMVNGYKNIKTEENYIDIQCMNQQGQKIFFELKTAKTVKMAIREAIGQLLEYNHYSGKEKADKLIIVTVNV